MQQVNTLTSRKQFGLVFQEHSPESVRLPQQRVRTGDKVELRESKQSAIFHVISTKASLDVATVVKLDESGETVGESQDMLKTDLVVVKPFGDPVYPGLRQEGEAGSAKPGQPTHVVINGENYHALQALEYTHAGKVDLIYIDPPYNTGAADWKYNDKYIDGSDSYRHSKWLSFMDKRLRIAKSLLKDTGVIVLAIDDNEHHRLRMLADQIFGENNFISNIVWQGGRKNDSRFVSNGGDYMLVYAARKDALLEKDVQWRETKAGVEQIIDAGARAWETSGKNKSEATKTLKAWFKNQPKDAPMQSSKHYSHVDDTMGREGWVYFPGDMSAPNSRDYMERLVHPVTGMECPIPTKGWRYSPPTMNRLLSEGRIHFGVDHSTTPTFKRYLVDSDSQVADFFFYADRRASAVHLEQVLGDKRFPFPKDHEVLSRWFDIMTPKDAVIVDFFAGSGTTAEAVIRLNEKDNGTRQAILVTNNELAKSEDTALRKKGFRPGDSEYEAMGVFHHVTKPRISTVLTGIREDGSKYSEGIMGQSAAFFDLTYEDENLISLGNKYEAIAPLLWMQSGATGELIAKRSDTSKGDDGYAVPEDGNYAVIFDTDSASEAIEAIHGGIEKVYIVTDSEHDFRAVAASLPGGLRNTAQRLYSSYLRSFEINRGR
jgi:adenine-specific DNA-methyltransferase